VKINLKKIEINPIGFIRKNDEKTWIEVKEEYKPALLNLDKFSHLITLWWIDQRDTEVNRKTLQVYPKVKIENVDTPLCGVFATRSPTRPNPIGLTIVRILEIIDNKIFIDRTDSFPDTPIIDLKPYIPNSDCIEKVTLPDFFGPLRKKRDY
jgi:tRNA-Thr(GGU) m(6)t(6)A37 methyltransferase TsaA